MGYKASDGDTLTVHCDGMDEAVDCHATLGPFVLERRPAHDSGSLGYITHIVGEHEAMLAAEWSRQRLPHTEEFRMGSGGHLCPRHWRWRQEGDPVDGRTAHEFLRDWTRS